jgi:hypothetical protein
VVLSVNLVLRQGVQINIFLRVISKFVLDDSLHRVFLIVEQDLMSYLLFVAAGKVA